MNKENNSFSIILPTLNESKNLEILVPQIYEEIMNSSLQIEFEIIVVDDSSEDNTVELIHELKREYQNLEIISRVDERSLSNSIYEGILHSSNDYIIWLDADGSMPAETVVKLISNQIKNKDKVIIGSRFVEGGGYKGISTDSSSNLLSAIFHVSKSKDSVLGLVLSLLFNKLLIFLLPTGVKDITSGFISLKKSYIDQKAFSEKVYGEYFIYLVTDLIKKDILITEIGYICETRVFGESKTAPNIFKLIKRGLPYIKASYNCRKDIYGNIRQKR
tara:strand:+ start:1087 stop:1911 length:825 start_codon:yes stop_codon:yes gene_type:complete